MTKIIYGGPKVMGGGLARRLGIPIVRPGTGQIKQYLKEESAIIINFGNSWSRQHKHTCTFINHPNKIHLAVDKIACLAAMEKNNVSTVEWTTEKETAEGWLLDGHTVYARTTITGRRGRGIVVMSPGDALVPAPLYTKRFRAKREYRVHCTTDYAFLVAQKKRRRGLEPLSKFVKNKDTGYVTVFRNVDPYPELLTETAQAAVLSLGLNFAAVDIMYAPSTGVVRVLEVNTRPGITCKSTLRAYLDFIRRV